MEDESLTQRKPDLAMLGSQIARLRRAQGLTQEELAERASMAPSRLSKIECGYVNSKLTTLIAISEALGTTMNELLGCRMVDGTADLAAFAPLLNGFSQRELQILYDVLEAAQESMQKHPQK